MPFSACPISAGALSAHSQTAVSEYVPPVYSGRSAPVYPPQILRFHSACAGAAYHGTSSGSAGPVAVSPASTAAALRPAARSFEKTPCLAPFLWYNCCEFTIRRRRSRPGRIGIAETAERLLWEQDAPLSSRKMQCPQSLDTPAIQALLSQVKVVKKTA